MKRKQKKKENRWSGIQSLLTDPQPKRGQTPKKEVWKINKATLWYYPSPHKKYNTPLFLIYSLINESYILDLSPGISMIESYVKEGYDVYLLDFGKLGYEDGDVSLDDYISIIQKGVKRALIHADSKDISLVGYCLGGTLAVIYAAIAQEPVKNLILFAPPINFSETPIMKKWFASLKNKEINIEDLFDQHTVVPARMVELVLRLAISPVTFSSYLSLLHHANDREAVKKWRLFHRWVKSHVPFAGVTLKQLINEVVRDNKLINNKLVIKGEPVLLSNIEANALVISTEGDQLVPEILTLPLLEQLGSLDKTYKREKGGHVTLAMTGKIPKFLQTWLAARSELVEK
ncbi:alpha/beta fold hydrolase [Alkalihalobacillus sp. MEB130]|uniref:alpha/beta fold hydrolase n=1 Tax=Alkalihalobacillus sp. MEB130 TaxID=2976704 RepID=UPI0028DF9CDB|nr:alpha/beta fold hydrolase [Alkalihalobacillus sp. MEB130]MDT8861587.1 alpha/beta fold hydrolase [Alkalihalobacillus sp. MEB130]